MNESRSGRETTSAGGSLLPGGTPMGAHEAIAAGVAAVGYDLVEIERAAGGLLRVTIDHPAAPGGGPSRAITVDDCERATRQLQHVLQVESLDYARLEVSSPGLDRPLRTTADFARHEGEPVELVLKAPFQGRKRYRGELQAAGDRWRLVLPDETESDPVKGRIKSASTRAGKTRVADASATTRTLDFSFDEVREARLVPVLDFKGRRQVRLGGDDGAASGHARISGGRVS